MSRLEKIKARTEQREADSKRLLQRQHKAASKPLMKLLQMDKMKRTALLRILMDGAYMTNQTDWVVNRVQAALVRRLQKEADGVTGIAAQEAKRRVREESSKRVAKARTVAKNFWTFKHKAYAAAVKAAEAARDAYAAVRQTYVKAKMLRDHDYGKHHQYFLMSPSVIVSHPDRESPCKVMLKPQHGGSRAMFFTRLYLPSFCLTSGRVMYTCSDPFMTCALSTEYHTGASEIFRLPVSSPSRSLCWSATSWSSLAVWITPTLSFCSYLSVTRNGVELAKYIGFANSTSPVQVFKGRLYRTFSVVTVSTL